MFAAQIFVSVVTLEFSQVSTTCQWSLYRNVTSLCLLLGELSMINANKKWTLMLENDSPIISISILAGTHIKSKVCVRA